MGRTMHVAQHTDSIFHRLAPSEWRRPGWRPGMRTDSAESAWIERALLEVEKQPYNILVPPMKGREFLPTDNTSHQGAKSTSYKQYTRTGVARLMTDAGKDVPLVGLFVKEYEHQFYLVSAGYQISYLDLLAMGFALSKGESVNLDAECAIAAREAIEKKLDLIAAFGSQGAGQFALELEEDVGLVGLITNPTSSSYVIPPGAAGSTAWSSKTPDEILADLNGIVAYQVGSTFEIHRGDEIIVPTTQAEQQLTRSMGDGRSDTIGSYFVRTRKESGNPVKISSWPYLAGAGAGSTDRMILHKRDPRMAKHMISMEATPIGPAQQDGLLMTTILAAKTAGAVVPYPLSITTADGL